MEQAISNTKPINIYEKANSLFIQGNSQQANEMAKQVYNQAFKSKNYELAYKCLFLVAECNEHEGKLAYASKNFNTCLSFINKFLGPDFKGLGNLHNRLGVVNFKQKNEQSAIHHFLEAKKYGENQARCLVNIGNVYSANLSYEKAIEYFNEALSLAETDGDNVLKCFSLLNLSISYEKLGRLKKAFQLIKEGMLISQSLTEDEYEKKRLKIHAPCLYANLLFKTSADLQAKNYFELALENAEKFNVIIDKLMIMNPYCEFLYQVGDYQKFEEGLTESLEIAEKHKLNREIHNLLELAVKAYKEKGDFEKACEYGSRLLEDIRGEQNLNQIHNLERLAEEREVEIKYLEKQKNTIEQQKKELEEFTYVLAHDLKEPLRNIVSFTDLLERRHVDSLDKEGGEYFKIVSQAAHNLNKKLIDLLNYANYNSERYSFKKSPLNLHAIVMDLKMELLQNYSNNDLIIKLDRLPEIFANERHMITIFSNIMNNAIEFNQKEQCEIDIVYKDLGSYHMFEITDNGDGIEADFQNKIFEIFKRLELKGHNKTGIGLPLCKKIVELYNGKIWVESELGYGSSFFFTIEA